MSRNTAITALLANVTTSPDTTEASGAEFSSGRAVRAGDPNSAPDGPTAAAWLAMSGDEIDALDDQILMARIVRFRYENEKGKTRPLVVYTPDYTPDPEDAKITARLMAENRAKNLGNSLGAKYEAADLKFPMPGQEAVYRRLSDWARNPRPDTLVLWGTVGTGKTHAAAAMGIAVAGPRQVPTLVTWEDLADAWMHGSNISDDLMVRRARTRGRVQAAQVLIIDDMYRRKPSEYTSAELAALLANRQGSGCLTIITTNVAPLDTTEGGGFRRRIPVRRAGHGPAHGCGEHPHRRCVTARPRLTAVTDENGPGTRCISGVGAASFAHPRMVPAPGLVMVGHTSTPR